jgi:protein phosphatase methylesterase 1
MVCHHGAGASGLSFAALAKELKGQSGSRSSTAEDGGELGVLAYDARGHGEYHAPIAIHWFDRHCARHYS